MCQLDCPVCWIRGNEKAISKTEGFGYLKFKNFKKLVDDNPQIKEIELAYSGEVFLNPELDKIIEYAYKKNIKLTADCGVNLNYLPDKIVKTLVKYKFKSISVAIDGATPESYAIYRRGGNFNKVIANIEKINKYKKIYNSDKPILTWKFIIFGHNEHEIELAKVKSKELNMNIYFEKNSFEDYSPVKNKELVQKQTGINYSLNTIENNHYDMCSQLFERPQINYNGNLIGCCTLVAKNFGVNVFKVGLLNALNYQSLVQAKHMLTDFNYMPTTQVPCSDCYYYNNVLKKNNTPLPY